MNIGIVARLSPEEAELRRKLDELERIESELTQRELDLTTLSAELQAVEAQYLRIVGSRYADLDRIRAEIAESLARLRPNDPQVGERARRARAQADESAFASAAAGSEPSRAERFSSSTDLRGLYRDVAKRVHPDLTTDPEERERRHRVMAEANRAYEDGDDSRLRTILAEWESRPEAVTGEDIGAKLIRVIRKLAQVRERLRSIEAEIERLHQSEISQLKAKIEKARLQGRDLIAEMAEAADAEIASAKCRLEGIRKGAGQ